MCLFWKQLYHCQIQWVGKCFQTCSGRNITKTTGSSLIAESAALIVLKMCCPCYVRATLVIYCSVWTFADMYASEVLIHIFNFCKHGVPNFSERRLNLTQLLTEFLNWGPRGQECAKMWQMPCLWIYKFWGHLSAMTNVATFIILNF